MQGKAMAHVDDDPLCLVFVPALVTLLCRAESELGAPLNEAQVLAIRDNAHCIALPQSTADKLEDERGYADIVAETCWEAWQAARDVLFAGKD